jgi:hypothetical protein
LLYQEMGAGGWQELETPPQGIFAEWSLEDRLTARIDSHVAHYTGESEKAEAIEEGMRLLERGAEGDQAEATRRLGRAIQLAQASGDEETTRRLARVVDIVDAPSGTVRLKRNVAKADQMELILEAHTTKRVRRGNPTEPNVGS